ncbi:MAG: CDP-alcohol phosphatidyltransferase family protein [Proteobacteria bacterium]|nr:CDP-alcohol phosphatidyltransferase family protein [Pseudomonadota bacterium]
MISSKIGHALDPVILGIYRFFFKDKVVNPNILTICGVPFGFAASACIAFDYMMTGGILLAISGFFDLMDGAVARNANRVTKFGGFLDSVLDRYVDLLIMLGVFIHFLRHGDSFYSIIVFIAAVGTAIIPYAKARAEAASLGCNTGILERPERLVIVFVGLCFNVLEYAFIILAVLTHVTVIQRIVFVKRNS